MLEVKKSKKNTHTQMFLFVVNAERAYELKEARFSECVCASYNMYKNIATLPRTIRSRANRYFRLRFYTCQKAYVHNGDGVMLYSYRSQNARRLKM